MAPDVDPYEYAQMLAADVEKFLDGGDFDDSDDEHGWGEGDEAAGSFDHGAASFATAQMILCEPSSATGHADPFDNSDQRDHNEFEYSSANTVDVELTPGQDTAGVANPYSGKDYWCGDPWNTSVEPQFLMPSRPPPGATGHAQEALPAGFCLTQAPFMGHSDNDQRNHNDSEYSSATVEANIVDVEATLGQHWATSSQSGLLGLEMGDRLFVFGVDNWLYPAQVVGFYRHVQIMGLVKVRFVGRFQQEQWVGLDRIPRKQWCS